MKLIVDSGSTKATWCVCTQRRTLLSLTTEGINPVRDSADVVEDIVGRARAAMADGLAEPTLACADGGERLAEVWFYGAGCLPAYVAPLRAALREAFAGVDVEVASDLLGAARALLGHTSGIACILGTGSNSCLYDGRDVVANVSPLGWILGDEGSGAVLGRTLVGDVLKRQLPEPLCDEFLGRYGLTAPDIIDAVYRRPQPNRFLASLVPFLAEHRDVEQIHRLLVEAFRSFFVRNVLSYRRADLPVAFVGGVAYQFENELREAAQTIGCRVGEVVRDPMSKMVAFHQQ